MPGPEPLRYKCPSCKEDITTVVRQENTAKTHIMAAILCILFFPCVFLPYYFDNCKK